MESKKLEVGEKYLTIQLSVLGQTFKVTAFPNKEKNKDTAPDFKNNSDGVAVWVNQKKAEATKPKSAL